jgi:hypothetical protein
VGQAAGAASGLEGARAGRRSAHPSNHYKEITCFVQGKKAASVIVAAALTSAWPKYGAWMERAVNAWEVR